jgi:hypothetical protein
MRFKQQMHTVWPHLGRIRGFIWEKSKASKQTGQTIEDTCIISSLESLKSGVSLEELLDEEIEEEVQLALFEYK